MAYRRGAEVVPPQRERDFQTQVIDLARICGWRVAHFRPAMTKHGWRTPVAADGKGFPDLVLVRRDRVLWRELKSDSGRLSTDQALWITALQDAGEDVAVWRPDDFDEIVEALT